MGDSKGAQILSLPQLQNLIKRDPESYRDEFLTKYSYYKETLGIFQQRPTGHDENLVSVVTFLAQVAQCYTDVMAEFPQDLLTLLHHQGPLLDSDMRMTFCQALMLLRRRGLVPATTVLELCFRLFRCPDKLLRKTLYNYIVQDIKRVNAKHKNAKLNTTLQNFMYTMLRDNHQIAAKMSIDVMIDLYRRNIWNDVKTVNVIKEALFSKLTKVLVSALKFFLGSDRDGDDGSDSDSEPDEPKKTGKELLMAHRVAKKSRKRQRRLDRALQMLKKNKKKSKPESFNFSAVHLIHDPQGLAEKLFNQLETSCRNERHEVKLMVTNLISRLVGIHQLMLENFYPYIAKKFVGPHRRDVTKYLMFLAQASHELVPPDTISAVVQEIVNNFVNDKSSSEVMAVGINAVREICARCPLAMDADLLHYLSEHKTHRDKSVQVAARSLIQLFRDKNPHLLHHKYRGRPTQAMKEAEVLEYAQLGGKEYIPGAEVLRETADIVEQQKEQDEWESCSSDEDDNDSNGSWVDVHHSSDDEQNKSATAAADDDSLDPKEKAERARRIIESRLLTQEEFKQIQSRQLAKQVGADRRNGRGTKRPRQDSEERHEDREIVPLSSIEFVHKKRCHDRESRLATVMAGREGRDKFSRPEKRQNPNASSTNKEKRKTKNFMMVKHKIQKSKGKRSFQDKQMALKSALLRKIKRQKK